MRKDSKRGLSPVIATSLLIAIALVLALIIFLWAKNFMGEVLQKDLGGGLEPIQNACDKIAFMADVDGGNHTLSVENTGNVPIYGVEVKKVGLGSVESKSVLQKTISNGETVNDLSIDNEISSGDEVTVVPIVIGQASSGKKQQYICLQSAQSITAL